MRFKFTSTLIVTGTLACAGVAAAASAGIGNQRMNDPAGLPGTTALSGVQTVNSTTVNIPSGSSASVQAYCPSGMKVIGTGFYNSLTDVAFVKAYGTFVGGMFRNNSSITIGVHVQAVCASETSGLTSLSSSSGHEDFERDVRQTADHLEFMRLNSK